MSLLDQRLYAYSMRANAERTLLVEASSSRVIATDHIENADQMYQTWWDSLPRPIRWLLRTFWPVPNHRAELRCALDELDSIRLHVHIFEQARQRVHDLLDAGEE